MKEYKEYEAFDPNEEVLDLKPFVSKAIKSWKKILLWGICGAVIGIVIGLSTPKTYKAVAVVAPEIATRSTIGNGLSTLASLAGVNTNTMALTDAMHPDLYPEIIKSSNFYINLFDLPVQFMHADTLVRTDLYDYVANYTKVPWYAYVIKSPRIAFQAVKNIFKVQGGPEDILGHSAVDSLHLTKQQDQVVRSLSKKVSAVVDKRTYVLSITVSMQDRFIAAQLANAVVDNLQKFVVKYRTGKAMENVQYYERVYEEIHDDYLKAQRKYADYVDSHLGSMSQSSKVRGIFLQNEAQLKYQMYNSTAQNLLAAKAKVQQESPVLVVLQQAMPPYKGKPSLSKLAIAFLLIGAVAGFIVAALPKKE